MDWTWLNSLWQNFAGWLKSLIEPTLQAVWKFLKAVAAAATFAASLASIIWSTMDVGTAFDNVADTMNDATALLGQLPIANVISQLNRIFPLNELLVFSSLLLGLKVLIIGIKIISWLIELLYRIISVIVQITAKLMA